MYYFHLYVFQAAIKSKYIAANTAEIMEKNLVQNPKEGFSNISTRFMNCREPMNMNAHNVIKLT